LPVVLTGVELGRTHLEEHELKVIVKGAEEDDVRNNRRKKKTT